MESESSLAPLITMQNHQVIIDMFCHLSNCVRHGGVPYKKLSSGKEFYENGSVLPKQNEQFNDRMACMTKITMGPLLLAYKDGFGCMGSLVDVGGGIGGAIYEIGKSHPHIRGFSFDLPHVISTAPSYDGVITHVAGDMFEAIPCPDAIFIKVNQCISSPNLITLVECKKLLEEAGITKISAIAFIIEAYPI